MKTGSNNFLSASSNANERRNQMKVSQKSNMNPVSMNSVYPHSNHEELIYDYNGERIHPHRNFGISLQTKQIKNNVLKTTCQPL